jgi:hypothetical protein
MEGEVVFEVALEFLNHLGVAIEVRIQDALQHDAPHYRKLLQTSTFKLSEINRVSGLGPLFGDCRLLANCRQLPRIGDCR